MKYVITADEMKRADAATMERFHVPSCVLMERAALAVRDEIRSRFPQPVRALIVCGTGNNGGDGMALARLLVQQGDDVTVVCIGDPARASQEARRQMEILDAYGIAMQSDIPAGPCDIVADAIFGISLSRDIEGKYADAIRKMNDIDAFKIAVDISSGVDADSGQIRGIAFRADLTVTMAYAKYGQFLYPGRTYSGELAIAGIGITDESFGELVPRGCFYEKSDLSRIPPRKADSNKGTYGKLLSVTGSENMAGASYFASLAAYRVGAGLVYIETPEANRAVMQSLLPEAVLYTYWNGLTAPIREQVSGMTAVICGCGIGTGDDSRAILENLLRSSDKPLVLDADALNLLSENALLHAMANAYAGALIITPHVGEAARLLGCRISDIKKDPLSAARTLSEELSCICVLKDAVTIVAQAQQIYLNTSGTNAMAKGGSGDVLTGVIGGLLAQGADPWTAATVGVYLHGLSGEEAASKTGDYSMIARDLTDGITKVLGK